MAVLRDQNNRDIPLRGKITLFGRDPSCDIVVNTERTSWRHCLVFHSSQGYAVEDLDSVNGTFLNGTPVRRSSLEDGDELDVAGHVFTVRLQRPAP